MGEARELQQIYDKEPEEPNLNKHANRDLQTTLSSDGERKGSWLRIALYIIFLLLGQSVAALLGRLYYEKGGNSKWVSTLVQLVGFPILIPYYCILLPKKVTQTPLINTKPPSFQMLAFVYVCLGLLMAGTCFLYSVGMQYLPISTVTLIFASQLAFNAFFSYFLNSQKFTPLIINSLVLLTLSSVLLVFQKDSAKPAGVSKPEYAAGFICTVGAAAGCGLLLVLQQLAFRKILKKQTFRVVMDVIIYQSVVASSVSFVGFFASGDWKGLKGEMERYALGKVSYVMTLSWTAIAWQVFSIGAVGLVFEVSAVFCNAISVVGLPIVPVVAVFIFHDKMDGIKAIALLLAIWGFISYAYQHYLDNVNSKTENRNSGEVSGAASFAERA